MKFLPAMTAVLVLSGIASASDRVQYNRQVRPILSAFCWRCHGPDARSRQAELRLDQRGPATEPRASGKHAVIPGDTAQSELIKRIQSTDPSLRMPPPETNLVLSAEQIEVLAQWIQEGAEYQGHWSFEPLTKPDIPAIEGVENPIDAFVAQRLHAEGLDFAPQAPAETLLRRLSFDLIGLPPTLEDLSKLETETYEQAVDRLLASPHFGERMAVDWLDAARFADTHGYFGDKPRQVWLWRDWVINAFNANLPFDQFTIEQLAGDLLPDASISQRIATGFNRNHMSNDETGLIDEEYRVEYVNDRVEATFSTWMGLTVGCAQCHDHKFDPITQREYYQLFAFFNQVPEKGLLYPDDPQPFISVPSEEQQARSAQLAQATGEAVAKFEPLRQEVLPRVAAWEKSAGETLPRAPSLDLTYQQSFSNPIAGNSRAVGTTLQFQQGINGDAVKLDATQHVEAELPQWNLDQAWTVGMWILPDGTLSCLASRIEPQGNRRGLEALWQKGRISVNLVHQWGVDALEWTTRDRWPAKKWHHVVISYDGSRSAPGLQVWVDGSPAALDCYRDSLSGTISNDQPLRIGRRDSGLGFYGQMDEMRILGQKIDQTAATDWFWGERIRGIIAVPLDKRSGSDSDLLLDYFIDRHETQVIQAAREAVRQAAAAEQAHRSQIPTALVMQELPQPRQTFVLQRGQYGKPGDEVQPGVPKALSTWPEGVPANRLGLANWLVSPQHPLTARVAVNRLWRQCFGEGLVRTMNDFGSQGELPTHPELLDYLAATFRDNGWDVKSLLKLIVTSRTYRQSSRRQLRGTEVFDVENRLLGRGPSFRLPMEMIRDQALAASGLLVPKVGGPSVKPYQPPGLWEEVSYNAEETYEADQGDGLWRRSLYTYVKRQAPPPTMLIFDGPTREKCALHRPRTNTPLQALVLLNDVTYLEAARVLAARVLQSSTDDVARVHELWRRVLSRSPRESEVEQLLDLVQRQRDRFRQSPQGAMKVISVGAAERLTTIAADELAAWSVAAHTVFNLDEAVSLR